MGNSPLDYKPQMELRQEKPEGVPLMTFPREEEASVFTAREIGSLIREKQSRGEKCVLGLATGSSPVMVYDELVRMHRREGLSFRNVITFNLDEYYPMSPSSPHSYVRFMEEHLFNHIDMDPHDIHIPDGTVPEKEIDDYCRRYDEMITEAGGIDLQILGIGRNGHIGFNEPGSWPSSPTRLVNLDRRTITDAAKEFSGEENVPSRAITMGVGTILKARRILLLAWGETKSSIIKESVKGQISDSVPASHLQRHGNACFIVDRAAASALG